MQMSNLDCHYFSVAKRAVVIWTHRSLCCLTTSKRNSDINTGPHSRKGIYVRCPSVRLLPISTFDLHSTEGAAVSHDVTISCSDKDWSSQPMGSMQLLDTCGQ